MNENCLSGKFVVFKKCKPSFIYNNGFGVISLFVHFESVLFLKARFVCLYYPYIALRSFGPIHEVELYNPNLHSRDQAH